MTSIEIFILLYNIPKHICENLGVPYSKENKQENENYSPDGYPKDFGINDFGKDEIDNWDNLQTAEDIKAYMQKMGASVYDAR